MLKVHDITEIAYGGLVTGLERMDKKRVTDGKIRNKDILKKYSTYAYAVPGAICTAATAMGWMRRYDAINERIAHGFLFGLPGFIMDIVDATGEGGGGAARSTVRDAEQFLRERTRREVRQTPGSGFQEVEPMY